MYRRSEYEDDILKAVYMPEVGQRPSSRFRTTFAQQCRARTQPDLSRGNLRRGAPGPLHPCPAQLGRGVLGLAGTSISEVPHRGPHREGPDIGTSHRKQGPSLAFSSIDHHIRTDVPKQKLTAPGIPRRSPIQVLTRPDVA